MIVSYDGIKLNIRPSNFGPYKKKTFKTQRNRMPKKDENFAQNMEIMKKLCRFHLMVYLLLAMEFVVGEHRLMLLLVFPLCATCVVDDDTLS